MMKVTSYNIQDKEVGH